MSRPASRYADLLPALKVEARSNFGRVFSARLRRDYLTSDRAALNIGPFARDIARRLDLSHAATRRLLKKAEAEGLVISDPCAGGCTRWWPVSFAAELLAEVDAKPATCRVCGCTDLQACPGGCCWVQPDLCSACDPPW